MEEPNKQTPKLRFRQSQTKPIAIEADPKQLSSQPNRLPSGSKNVIALPRLDSRTATQSLVQVDKDLNQLEINSRVRDLEVMMIDFKANIERRISKTIEDNPQKYMQSFKQLEQQEMQLWKQMNDKQIIIQDQVSQLRNITQQNRDSLSQMILELQKKLNEQEFKLQSIQNQQQGIEGKMNVVQQQPVFQNSVNNNDLELKLLREAFNNEKSHRDTVFDDLQRQWQDAHQRLMKQENEFYGKLQQQREEFIDQNEKTKIAIKAIDNMKLQKINQDQDYIKNLIGGVESRIADEVEKRLRSEFEQRSLLENKIQAFKDEIRNDEKQILLGEQKFMKQMHDSVTSLNQIIKNTKEQFEANLAASQTLLSENIRTISKIVETFRESTTTKVNQIEQGLKDNNYKVSETRQMMHEHATLINNSLQNEFIKIQEQLQLYEKQQKIQEEQQMKILNDERQINEEWKKQFAQKNLIIFTEVSTNLKNIKQEMNKEKIDHQENHKKINQDLDLSNKKNLQLMQNLEQKVIQNQQIYDFKQDQQKKDLLEIINNLAIELNTDINNKNNQLYTKIIEDTKQFTLDQVQTINERIGKELELTEQQTNYKLEQQQLLLKKLIREREDFLINKTQSLIDEEKELRQRLQEAIEKYADMIRKYKDDINYEIQTVKTDFDQKLINQKEEIQRDYNDKFKEQESNIKQDIMNMELKIQQKLDVLSVVIQKQLDSLKQYIQNIEKNIKSFVKQQLEQQGYELKAMIKEIENDLFKLRIWLLKQIEQMNQSMKDIHIQIQSEMYMDRIYNLSIQEQFQDHTISILNKEKQDRLQWQFALETQLNQLDTSLNGRMDSTHKEIKSNLQDLENQITNKLNDLDQELKSKIQELSSDIEKQIQELGEKVKQDMTDLFEEIEKNINQLRIDTQEGLNDVVNKQIESGNELKKQIDICYYYFEAKLFIVEQIRQANEELDKERHTGIIGKLQLLVKEMERLEEKKNKIKKDLNDFIKGVQDNFSSITDAIKAHGQYLNELDAKLTLELILQSTINEAQQYQIEAQLISVQKDSEGKINELDERLTNLDKTVHDQIEQIQIDQEEINQKNELQIKNQQIQIKEQQTQTQQIIGNQELMKSMTGAMELNMSNYIKQQIQQSLELFNNTQKLMLQNIKILDQNLQAVMSEELKHITDYINDNSKIQTQKTDDLENDLRKLFIDYGNNFENVEAKIQALQNRVNGGEGDAQNVNNNVSSFGVALQSLQDDVKRENQRLQEQIDNLTQATANRDGLQQKLNNSNNQNNNSQIQQNLEALETEINRIDGEIVKLKKITTQPQQQSDNQQNMTNAQYTKLQENIDEVEDQLHKRLQAVDTEIENLKKQKDKGGSIVNNQYISKDDFEKFQSEMDTEFNKIEEQLNNIQQQSPQGQVNPKQPGNSTAETQQLKEDVKKLNKQYETLQKQLEKLDQNVEDLFKMAEEDEQV